MFQANVVGKINAYILSNIFPLENIAVYGITWKNIAEWTGHR
jgi:hypothetical protein